MKHTIGGTTIGMLQRFGGKYYLHILGVTTMHKDFGAG
jgi:hypothetical protein